MQGIYEASVEIDLFTAPAFATALRAQIDTAATEAVFIDCAAITFMDSSALHALLGAHRYAIEQRHSMVLRNVRPNCARVLGMCDWENELTIES